MNALPAIAFFEPRIPNNTGNAIRTSAVTGSPLRLIEPLGFDLSEPKLRRAGLDYHDLATVTVHPSLDAMLEEFPEARVFAFTGRGETRYTDVTYEPTDILLFGPEPTGLPDAVLAHPRITAWVRIPMLPGRRSLNLSNSAAIAAYEAARQAGFDGHV
ncbi:tRNA (cytidine(34)-2'-O)-methyltransferase [Demequina sp. NBRC 110052]|uniref:tRNA (cytidine(34)-2'-O)-methyltransferase n=1 Tax=Demequina sp. NBRC 110052 TaxID=1570341 RepID=UPI000A0416F2|nr:tRNA (cytidine(34)-2'-O)-methyltransferase [Demequina sp. NBRC 110052]